MSGEHFTADILGDCTMGAKHRRRHRGWDRITWLRIGLASEELSELPRVSRDDLPFVDLEGRTRCDRGRDPRDPLGVDVAELSGSIDDEASERVQCRLSIRAFRNSGKESLLAVREWDGGHRLGRLRRRRASRGHGLRASCRHCHHRNTD
jgi:hypothetical protein